MRCGIESSARSLALGCLGVLAGFCSVSRADEPREPQPQSGSTAAQALFETGRQLMEQGRLDEACPKLEESQRLEAATGTLLNLALCREQQGRSATAWLLYKDVLALATREGNAEREAIARQRLEALGKSLSTLTLPWPADPPEGLWLTLDGVRMSSAVAGTRIPVDPGDHLLQVGASGRRTAAVLIHVGKDASHLQVRLPELERERPIISASAAPPVTPATSTSISPAVPTRWILQGAAIGVGLSGLAAGTYFGLRAASEWDVRNERCREGCDEKAVAAADRAERAALMSTVSFGIGIAALVAGGYLFLTDTADDDEPPRLRVTGDVALGRAGIWTEGRF
jgi:hypothetical protein